MVSRRLKGAASPANWARKMAGPLIVFTVELQSTHHGARYLRTLPMNPDFFVPANARNPTIVEHFTPVGLVAREKGSARGRGNSGLRTYPTYFARSVSQSVSQSQIGERP